MSCSRFSLEGNVLQLVWIAAQIGAIDELASAYSSTWHGDIYSLIVHAPLHFFNYKRNIQIKVTCNWIVAFLPFLPFLMLLNVLNNVLFGVMSIFYWERNNDHRMVCDITAGLQRSCPPQSILWHHMKTYGTNVMTEGRILATSTVLMKRKMEYMTLNGCNSLQVNVVMQDEKALYMILLRRISLNDIDVCYASCTNAVTALRFKITFYPASKLSVNARSSDVCTSSCYEIATSHCTCISKYSCGCQ
jgi:hypothetical protein